MRKENFSFTISDTALFLGKSPVTLRGWEAKGFVAFPRLTDGERRLRTNDVRDLARKAYDLKRITRARRDLIWAAMTILELIEK